MNILIRNATIQTMNEKNEVLENASIAIENDRIKYVGSVPDDFKADKVIEGKKKTGYARSYKCTYTYSNVPLKKLC